MDHTTRTAGWAVAVAAGLFAGVGPAQERPKDRPAAQPELSVMQRKLVHAQRVLEGLALNDFDLIRASSEGLTECAKDATWRINETEKYTTFSTDFLRRTDDLKEAGKGKKLDAAALAYVDMTLTCVKCHEYLREARPDRGPEAQPGATPAIPYRPRHADQKKPTIFQQKLVHAQQLLEGLSLNNFALIEAGAGDLARCAKEASWRVVKTPKYELYSTDLLRGLDGMAAAAKKRNLHAAALGYVDVTLACVKCHQHVRDVGVGLAPELTPPGPKTVATE